jgi:hypothetical protein
MYVDTHTQRHTDTQTHRQTHTQTHRQTDRQTDRHTPAGGRRGVQELPVCLCHLARQRAKAPLALQN